MEKTIVLVAEEIIQLYVQRDISGHNVKNAIILEKSGNIDTQKHTMPNVSYVAIKPYN